jgi:hypothetical protein
VNDRRTIQSSYERQALVSGFQNVVTALIRCIDCFTVSMTVRLLTTKSKTQAKTQSQNRCHRGKRQRKRVPFYARECRKTTDLGRLQHQASPPGMTFPTPSIMWPKRRICPHTTPRPLRPAKERTGLGPCMLMAPCSHLSGYGFRQLCR